MHDAINTTENQSFKDSGTYAVKKAHQEKYVLKNGCNKVTIVRSYKTYSSDRLQLGEYEINHIKYYASELSKELKKVE